MYVLLTNYSEVWAAVSELCILRNTYGSICLSQGSRLCEEVLHVPNPAKHVALPGRADVPISAPDKTANFPSGGQQATIPIAADGL